MKHTPRPTQNDLNGDEPISLGRDESYSRLLVILTRIGSIFSGDEIVAWIESLTIALGHFITSQQDRTGRPVTWAGDIPKAASLVCPADVFVA